MFNNATSKTITENVSTCGKPQQILLKDLADNGMQIKGYIENNNQTLAIHIDGYSDYCSNDDNGTPIYLELFNGKLQLIVYSDINQEDPTHIISLENCRNEKRID